MERAFIIFGGLPGTGKSTLALGLARRLDAVYLRIDTIEQAILAAEGHVGAVGESGYLVGYAVAVDNLRLGHTVVSDSVNPLQITRVAWRNVATRLGVTPVEVEVVCSDRLEHRRRVETRTADIPGHRLPTWQDVMARDFEPWAGEHIRIDTAGRSVEQSLAALQELIPVDLRHPRNVSTCT
jgi:predicted kinase